MDYLHYQRKLNDVITKCHIEAGVEILVYNLIDEFINVELYSLVDINRLQLDRDPRLTTDGGMSDIAVLSSNFEYCSTLGKVYGFIEVKAASVSILKVSPQAAKQMKKVSHFIYTNGIVWKYFFNQQPTWEVNLSANKIQNATMAIKIDSVAFDDLKHKLSRIPWDSSIPM